jgi:DNA-binding MarR family transcriptional regulator
VPAHRPTSFLLSQVGALATSRFAALLRPLGLTPSDTGVLRILSRHEGLSQRDLAGLLGSVPSRVVAILDSLETRGLVVRQRRSTDRRNHDLALTTQGEEMLRQIRTVGQEHESTLLAPLDPQEREQLAALLTKLAAAHELDPEVHPGYRPNLST